MLEKLWNFSTVYTMTTIANTILGFWMAVFFYISALLTFSGIFMVVMKFRGTQINNFFYRSLEDFRKISDEELSKNWKIEYPTIVTDIDKNAIKSNLEIINNKLRFETLKKSVGIEDQHAWEGTEIISNKEGFNAVLAKLMLNLEKSKSEESNIYIKGTGQTGKYEYYLGIGSTGPDIFFHIVDLEDNDRVYEERGRLHLKDYLQKDIDWMYLGIEWTFEGPKIFAFIEGEKHYSKIPMNPPPSVKEDILEDSQKINLFGLEKLAIRTDLNVSGHDYEKVTGEVQYIDVKYGYLTIFNRIKNEIRKRRMN